MKEKRFLMTGREGIHKVFLAYKNWDGSAPRRELLHLANQLEDADESLKQAMAAKVVFAVKQCRI